MDRRRFLKCAMVGLAAAILPGIGTAQNPRRKPNFILVLTDDLGYGDIEPYGGAAIPTPAINRMAKEGLVATDYYCPANLCTPSRAGILTGRYPVRTGLGYEVILYDDDRVLPLSEKTIASVLKPDYATALIGKWHLGHTGPTWMPMQYGFDLFYGLPYSHDILPLPLYDADAKTGRVTSIQVDGSPDLQQQFYTRAESFIEANRDRPFYIHLTLSTPHLPSHPQQDFKGKSKAGAYGDTVLEIDSIMGRLFAKLRTLHIEQDTIVFLTSDNGAWFEGSNGSLRDRKGGPGYDGGYRVPLIAWAPGRIKPGSRTDAILCGIDFFPTFCSMAGLGLPTGVEMDGRDISAVLTKGAPSPHKAILLFNNEDVVAIRMQKWKYVDQTSYRNLPIPLTAAGYPELYDMTWDRSESYSLAANYPSVVQEMQASLKQANETYAPFKKGVPLAILKAKQKMQQQLKQD